MMPPRFHTPAGKSRFAPTVPVISPPPAPISTPRPVTPVPKVDDAQCTSNKVRVVARIRPSLPYEIHNHVPTACFSFTRDSPEETTLHVKDLSSRRVLGSQLGSDGSLSDTCREGTYKLDSCYNGDDEISVLFDNEVKHFLPKLFEGQNATVFAYGATGSGKTYTMQGSDGHPGLMTLAMKNILEMAAQKPNYRVEVAYYQIYNERILDLLDESNADQIKVLEDTDGKTYLRGLSQVHVETMEKFNELLVDGCLRRRVGQTGLNIVSSRSHAALVVTIVNHDNAFCHGKLNLIDLAGNEDNKKTGNEGNRLVESARINQSLFVLSNVITALNSNNPRVPYRDSKLTRILQDSLGGTSHTIMIACLNRRSYQEANQTLTIAARSRQIPNKTCEKKDEPEPHIDMNEKLQAWRESKGKLPSNAPGTPKAKPLFYTPSRQQVNQIRRSDKNFTKDTPKARRALVLKQSNGKVDKQKEMTHISSSLSSTSNTSNTSNTEMICVDQNEKSNQLVEISDQMSSLSVCPAREKENETHGFDTHTPSIKPISRTSSPPLSERLFKLRAAFREILQPINDNLLPPVPQCTDIVVKKLNSDVTEVNVPQVLLPPKPLTEVDMSPIASTHKELTEVDLSPHKTPAGTIVDNEIDNDFYSSTPMLVTPLQQKVGTPLEKLSVRSSGLKNTIAKEYINFLNTASREELLELKGIGEKRAAYILSLREHSPEPIKEIEDLEKIGISRKQAISLFNHTARHILFK
uniref:Kinesin-like protein n=1 Tax=Marsilea vestita TaxID=59764 RepID=A0A142KWB4_MARVE|nr:kinesin 10 protein [Marsilea vestita]